jgi:hypothetical protein
MSNGKLTALKHQVELPGDLESERYSFAMFSFPKPDSTLTFNGEKLIRLFINAATAVLYLQRDLDYYLPLTFVYFVFSVVGVRKCRTSDQLPCTSAI